MKRLALAALSLAFTGIGAGCIVTSNDCATHDVTIDWTSGFLGGDNVIRGCTDAAISSVDIYVDGQFDSSYACNVGSAVGRGVPSGSIITVEGIVGGRITYRAEAFTGGRSCSSERIAFQPAEGTLAVDYSFSPINACSTPPTYMWLKVRDEIAGQTAFIENGANVACSVTAAAPEFLVPAGSFTLQWIQEMHWNGSSYSVVGADCTDRSFVVAGGLPTTVSPVLVDTTAACL